MGMDPRKAILGIGGMPRVAEVATPPLPMLIMSLMGDILLPRAGGDVGVVEADTRVGEQ